MQQVDVIQALPFTNDGMGWRLFFGQWPTAEAGRGRQGWRRRKRVVVSTFFFLPGTVAHEIQGRDHASVHASAYAKGLELHAVRPLFLRRGRCVLMDQRRILP